MAARSAWAGAITFAGFPIPVEVFTVVKSRKSASFKMLDPVHKQPVHQVLQDIKGDTVERAATLRGVEYPRGSFTVLPEDALELIENVARSTAVEVERFAPVDTIDLALSMESYRIVPDHHVPGAEKPVQILWNGLRASERAAVIEDWCPRAGARPSTLVIRAVGDGLAGNLLPFVNELNDGLPAFTPEVDARAEMMFMAVVEQQYKTDAFDLAAYSNGYAERREAAIALALEGKTIEIQKPAEAPAAAPDLMAALEASLAAAGTPVPEREKAVA